MSSAPDSCDEPVVCAVIVTHDGARWLPSLLQSLGSSTRAPDHVVCVDTGSTDASKDLVQGSVDRVVTAPTTAGFGVAVDLALAAAEADLSARDGAGRDGWIWLLHDDCAPAPDALEHLLATALADPAIAVVGCRVRSWPRGRRLLEVGVSITGTGRRETGLEAGEYDQGQLDDVRTVLAVSSAGMLVRRRVWDELGGFDRRLPLFRDDVDFGWRVARSGLRVVVSPAAVVFHAEAATRGVRVIANAPSDPHRADREAALYTVLANCSTASLPWQYLRLGAGSALRAIGYLLGKLPSVAVAELLAWFAVAGRPLSLISARTRRNRRSAVPTARLRSLFPPWWTPYLDGLDAVRSRFARSTPSVAPRAAGDIAPSAPTMRGAHAATGAGAPGNVSAWLRAHALVSMALVLLVSAVLAARGLVGSGLLHGGALPPAPDRASDWWRLYEQSEHPVALGSSLVTAPYVVALGIAAFVLLGKAWLAVDVVMLLCVPLAAVGAYAAARRLISGSASRIWVAVSYALVPVLTGSVTTGHVGTVAALVVLPWLVCAARPLWVGGAVDGARAMAATGLVLALLAALTPVAYPMAAALLAIVAPLVAWQRRARTLALSVGALVLPVILLAPWSIRLITDPRLLLTEAGAVDPSTPSVSDVAWQLPFGRLGVGGAAPWWVSAGVVAAALVAVARPDRRGRVVLCWLVAALSLATAAVMAELVVVVPGAGVSAFAWLGFPVAVAQAAAILAVGLASDGLRSSLASGPFGVRQPFVAVVGLAALLSPAAGLVWWVTAASQGELSRHQTSVLPAYLTDELVSDTGRRALVLRRDGGRVTYQVVVGDGFRLGDDSVLPVGEPAQVTAVVGNLLSQPRPADVRRLGRLGVSYLLLPAPAEPADVVALDGLAGLTRASTDLAVVDGWRVVAGDQASSEVVGPPASASSGQPTVLSAHRPWWLAGQAAAWLVALVLAAPGLERRAGIARSHA